MRFAPTNFDPTRGLYPSEASLREDLFSSSAVRRGYLK
jgi:hypothetical protein